MSSITSRRVPVLVGPRLRSRVAACAVALATMGASGLAAAQAESEAAARELFNEARELAGKGQYAPACPKLEAASKLYRGSGLLITLGDCYEHLGRTASAWTTFGDAASVAAAIGRSDDEAEA